MNYLDIAKQILWNRNNLNLDDFPDLINFLDKVAINLKNINGQLRSRQVISLAIETWFCINTTKV